MKVERIFDNSSNTKIYRLLLILVRKNIDNNIQKYYDSLLKDSLNTKEE